MKINRVPCKKGLKFSFKSSIFMNIYYFFALYGYIMLLLLGLAIGCAIFLFGLNIFIPSTLESIDEKTTYKLFEEIKANHNYHAAIALYEYKKDRLAKSEEVFIYNTELSDCYIHIGDYSKAEKLLLDMFNNPMKEVKNLGDDKELIENSLAILKFGAARSLYQLYEKMGDTYNQEKYFAHMSTYAQNMIKLVDKYKGKIETPWYIPYNIAEDLDISALIQYDSICVLYNKNHHAAIKEMENYIDNQLPNTVSGPGFYVKSLNRLIKWQLENGMLIASYARIAEAVEIAKGIKRIEDYSGLGELSDYCYLTHDVKTSEKLFSMYQVYLDETYNKEDLEYLMNHSRSFRYLEAKGDVDGLITGITDCCIGMRKQIESNIHTMSEEQREHFASLFDEPAQYALSLLNKYPNEELATLCFDNIAFKSGLLLRSNLNLKQRVLHSNNQQLIESYKKLDNYRKELVYENTKGFSFFNNSKDLERKIKDIEKEIAIQSPEFGQALELSSRKSLVSRLNKDEAVVILVDDGQYLSALSCMKSGVQFTKLCDKTKLAEKLSQSIDHIYNDQTITQLVWSKLDNVLSGCRTIAYFPTGVFNEISLGSLPLSVGSYLCDKYRLRLLSNPLEYKQNENSSKNSMLSQVALWGGIYYEDINPTQEVYHSEKRGITRGDTLRYLPYSYDEVCDIKALLAKDNTQLFTDSKATELSFKKRSGKGDKILHVSSHGFFNAGDDNNKVRPMYNSGLFFAGANKYWCNNQSAESVDGEDGILRAVEISQLDFSQCDLVVLSACETGLGYNEDSEGVFGLQRAFKLAGSKKIMMSLWKVNDRVTARLMTQFYKYLSNGLLPYEALDSAKRDIRKTNPSPEDWGAFVILE